MKHREPPKTGMAWLMEEFYFRLGLGMLGAFAGCFVALFIGGPLIWNELVATPMERLLLRGAVAGACTGMLMPGMLFLVLQAIAYFVCGLFTGQTFEPPEETPKWIMVAFGFGVLYLTILAVL